MTDQQTDLDIDHLRFVKAFERPPIAHIPANTLYFEAGPLRIGVEYRELNEEIMAQVYGAESAARYMADQAERLGMSEAEPTSDLGDSGVSIHVFDAATGVEHLRFDDLDHNRHYHYLRADGRHGVVWFDNVANGDLVPWVLSTLGDRVGPMLELAGATELAARVDYAALAAVLPQVESAARAQAVQPSV